MKMNNVSLTRKWILLSLVLLAPEILAAENENLNFNYKRPDTLSLAPNVSKLAKVCHMLTDPLNIHVQFDSMGTQGVKVSLLIRGEDVGKGYAVYTLPLSPNMKAGGQENDQDDTNFNVPWGMKVRGGASLTTNENVTTPVQGIAYDDPFCFSEQTGTNANPDWAISLKHVPIYEKPPYAEGYGGTADYQKYCMNFTKLNNHDKETTYWPDFQNPSDVVREKLNAANSWSDYQNKYIFYRHKYTYDTGQTETKDKWISVQTEADSESSAGGFRYYFPISKDGTNQSLIRGGDFLMRLNNRNVTYLRLEISYNNGRTNYHFTWKREDDSYQSNDLVFQGITADGDVVSAGNIKDDPYQTFYGGENTGNNLVTKGYFRGTLLDEGSLNQKYHDYIKNIMPLSLPPKNRGNINLVSTDSLTFKIGDINGISNPNGPKVTVYGQPLKFGPLYGGQKLVASAMQLRNACY